jgi:hypothetical protein
MPVLTEDTACNPQDGVIRNRLWTAHVPQSHGDSGNIQIECSYTVTKEGLVKAKVKSHGGDEKVVEKVKNVVPVGMEFQFKWKVDGEAATLDEVDGKDTDQVKARLEGDYAKKD